MNILVFDTCLDKMYVTLAQDDRIVASEIITNKDNKYHSAFLISTIKNILKNNHLTPKNIDARGTNIGPGSFTGIRACTTVARMMAQQLNIPAAGISSLEILSKIAPENSKPLVALDARKDCAYLYIDTVIKGAVQLDEVEQIAKSGEYFVITDDKLSERLGGISYQQATYKLGEILADLAYKKLKDQECKWQELKPLYIQPPPVY